MKIRAASCGISANRKHQPCPILWNQSPCLNGFWPNLAARDVRLTPGLRIQLQKAQQVSGRRLNALRRLADLPRTLRGRRGRPLRPASNAGPWPMEDEACRPPREWPPRLPPRATFASADAPSGSRSLSMNACRSRRRRFRLVLVLRPAFLRDGHQSRCNVPQPHRGTRLVSLLPAGPAGAIRIDLALRKQLRIVGQKPRQTLRHALITD